MIFGLIGDRSKFSGDKREYLGGEDGEVVWLGLYMFGGWFGFAVEVDGEAFEFCGEAVHGVVVVVLRVLEFWSIGRRASLTSSTSDM